MSRTLLSDGLASMDRCDLEGLVGITDRLGHMSGEQLLGVGDALAYMTECTLATVEDLASRSRPPKAELARQTSIAQTGLDWISSLVREDQSIPFDRVSDLVRSGRRVEDHVRDILDRRDPTESPSP